MPDIQTFQLDAGGLAPHLEELRTRIEEGGASELVVAGAECRSFGAVDFQALIQLERIGRSHGVTVRTEGFSDIQTTILHARAADIHTSQAADL
ncbi:MAG: hypothetical protein AAF311_00780 [Pseudomonadota bacterium]